MSGLYFYLCPWKCSRLLPAAGRSKHHEAVTHHGRWLRRQWSSHHWRELQPGCLQCKCLQTPIATDWCIKGTPRLRKGEPQLKCMWLRAHQFNQLQCWNLISYFFDTSKNQLPWKYARISLEPIWVEGCGCHNPSCCDLEAVPCWSHGFWNHGALQTEEAQHCTAAVVLDRCPKSSWVLSRKILDMFFVNEKCVYRLW